MARKYTTAFAAAKHLVSLIETNVVGPQVEWGYPGENSQAELIWVGLPETSDQDPAALGQRSREERYRIPIYLDIAKNTSTPGDVNDRIAELTRTLEEVVHDDPHLGIVLRSDGWAQVGAIDPIVDTQPVTERAYGAVVAIWVDCRARI